MHRINKPTVQRASDMRTIALIAEWGHLKDSFAFARRYCHVRVLLQIDWIPIEVSDNLFN